MVIAHGSGVFLGARLGSVEAVADMQVSLGALGYNVGSTGEVNVATMVALADVADELPGIPDGLRMTLGGLAFVGQMPADWQAEAAANVEGWAEVIVTALGALISEKQSTPDPQPTESGLSPFELLLRQQAKYLPDYKPPTAAVPEPLVVRVEKKGFWRLDNLAMWGIFAAGTVAVGVGVWALKGR